jgi:UPF0716 protein FxsA
VQLLLVLAFLVVPIVEIYLIIQVGQVIGAPWTIALLVADSVLGAWLVRIEGRRTWRALRQAIGSGRIPSRELADAGLVLVGGTLLLTPGFLTDVVGFFLLLPVTRPVARRLLGWFVGRRLLGSGRAVPSGSAAPRRGDRPPYGPAGGPGHRSGDRPGDRPRPEPGDRPPDEPGDRPPDEPGDRPTDRPPPAGGRVIRGEIVEDGPADGDAPRSGP